MCLSVTRKEYVRERFSQAQESLCPSGVLGGWAADEGVCQLFDRALDRRSDLCNVKGQEGTV